NERVEEIREHATMADNECGEYERHKGDFHYEHVGWVIEQAERVEEFERQLERINDKYRATKEAHYTCSKSTSQLEQQNERYREALEFYADNDNYSTKYDSIRDAWGVLGIAEDSGEIARRALNESE